MSYSRKSIRRAAFEVSHFASLALLLLTLTACPFSGGTGSTSGPSGNAEGYGGRKSFYWIDPYYRCVRSQDGATIASYRGRLEYDIDGSITAYGDSCSDSSESVSISEIEPSAEKEVLGFREGIYEERASPPLPDDVAQDHTIALCQAFPAQVGAYDFRVRSEGSPPELHAKLLQREEGGFIDIESIRVGSKVRDGIRSIASMIEHRFLAQIDITSANPPRGYGRLGRMIYRSSSEVRQDILCRLSASLQQ